ncbi:ABC transporter ATP-binding protein [Pseudoclostridium thermosuccinogenes]|jgi:ATP-binding cassette subfamily B protein|uniref:ABC transporter ATP-binding protein n=1 Tax=Clostridium thermosuccinogenes TaxID=84032 RepID=UPI002FDB412E
MGKQIILTFLKKHKISYIIGIVFMLLTSYIQSLFPNVLGKTIDVLSMDGFETGVVMKYIALILLIALGTFITTYLWRNMVIVNARKLECHLREMLYNHFQKLSPEFYNKHATGDLIAYAINDISAIRMTLGPATSLTINGIVTCAIVIYSMTQSGSWQLTLAALLPIPFIIIFMLKIGKLIQSRFRRVQECFAAVSGRVNENINGIRVIKAYTQEDSEMENFQTLNNQMVEANVSMVRISSLLSPAIEIAFSISFVLNLIIGGNMVLAGSISLGDFIAFNGYLTMILRPVVSIGRVITIMERGMASLKRLNEVFDTEPQIKDGEKMISRPIQGDIEIRNLDFSYPGTESKALSDISIKIPKGHTLGIVGRTGSGKSTIANLLLKLYNVENGKIFIDGVDINDYSLATLRDAFGYVPQDNFLFSASIKDNITFFKPDFPDEKVEKAAKNSCIYDSIKEFPDGFDTILGERGVNLSGGQKQRVSIARAIARDPAILILDDSLSAVDTITEAKILDNFKRIRKNKTTIIIAHRLSAVESADEIIVMDNGRICERGTHEELLKKGGVYYGIYAEQTESRNDRLQ